MKARRFLLSMFVVLVTIYGCVSNPVTGRSEFRLISEAQEIAIGRQNFPFQKQLQGGVYLQDPELNAYVTALGQRLAAVSDRPHLPYEFVVLNDGTWNAWAMPGGKIAINRGLLLAMRNESELAAVLAHEIVHAAARHSAQQMERGLWMQGGVAGLALIAGSEHRDLAMTAGGLGAGLAMLRYSRAAEEEADYFGILYMIRAGIDPVGAVTLQELFAENMASAGGWLATHPASVERVRRNREAITRHSPGSGHVGEAEFRVRTRRLREQAPAYEAYDRGLRALRENQYAQALALSMEARRLLPTEAIFFGLSARAHLGLNAPDEALQAWDQAIQLNPDYFLFWLERGLFHEQAGRREQARRDLRRSLELLPTPAAREALARLES